MSKIKIAITGSIGSGKSEASNYLRELGFKVFDCDLENKKILDHRAYELLNIDFKECFVENKLDKRKLSEIVFNDLERKKKLESIMHPLILQALNKIDEEILFAEVPLLFESNWEQYFDTTLLIVADENICLKRLERRGLSRKESFQRLNNQMKVSEKMKRAQRIIYNNGSLAELKSSIDAYLKEILC